MVHGCYQENWLYFNKEEWENGCWITNLPTLTQERAVNWQPIKTTITIEPSTLRGREKEGCRGYE
jgi:hypothetical protein